MKEPGNTALGRGQGCIHIAPLRALRGTDCEFDGSPSAGPTLSRVSWGASAAAEKMETRLRVMKRLNEPESPRFWHGSRGNRVRGILFIALMHEQAPLWLRERNLRQRSTISSRLLQET